MNKLGDTMRNFEKVEVVMRRPGFWNILSNAMGWVAVVVAISAIALFALARIASFLWPTLKWMITIGVYIAINAWYLYRIVTSTDEVARSHRYFQATVLCVSNLIILAILFSDMRTVVVGQ